MKKHIAATLIALGTIACGGSSLDIESSKKGSELTDAERSTFCDYIADQASGCTGEIPGGSADACAASFTANACTVGELKACYDESCDPAAALEPCLALISCSTGASADVDVPSLGDFGDFGL